MKKILAYIQARLMEPSSVRGFIWLAASAGLIGKGAVNDISSSEALVTLAMLAAGVVGIVMKELPSVVHADKVEHADNVEDATVVLDSSKTTTKGP